MEPQLLFPALTLLILAVIWSATIKLIRVENASARGAAAAATLDLTNTYEAQMLRAVREIDQTLKLVGYGYQTAGGDDASRAGAVLSGLAAQGLLPPNLLFVVSIVDGAGNVIASTRPSAVLQQSVPVLLAALRARDTLWIDRTRQDPATGNWMLQFARRLSDGDDGLSGAVVVGVDSAYFVSGYDPQLLGHGGMLGVLGTDGLFRVRRTGEQVIAGDPNHYAMQLPAPTQSNPLVSLAVNRWDGVARFTGSQALYDYPLAVVVGLSEQEQLAAARRSSSSYLWRAAIGSLCIILLTGLLGRLSRQLARSRMRTAAAELQHAQRVEHLAYHDALTALPNRSLFNRLLAQAIRRTRRAQGSLAIAFIDLDRFKQINDTLGHEAGDRLLREVAERLQGCLRDSDFVARMGGDEFVVLLTGCTSETHIAAVAEKIVRAIGQPYAIQGQELCITASVGISLYPRDGEDEPTLTKNADLAMYQAKESGKNTYRFYSRSLNASWLERVTLEADLRHALTRGELELHYQARHDLASGHITGVEALLRWRHPQRGWVAPPQFLPIAEETGLILSIGRWVLQTACRQAVSWRHAGFAPLPLAVNVATRQLLDERWLADLSATLAACGLEPGLLEIEIHESALLHDEQRTLQVLAAMRSAGVRVALDGFGAAYAALGRAQPLPLDTLKIDHSHVQELAHQPGRQTAATLIALGRSLSVTVVAQGVETAPQAAALRAQACTDLQGFYFQRPMPPQQFERLLQRERDGGPVLTDETPCDVAVGGAR